MKKRAIFLAMLLVANNVQAAALPPDGLAQAQKWQQEGCDTDSDCADWDWWSEQVCEQSDEACDAGIALHSISPVIIEALTHGHD